MGKTVGAGLVSLDHDRAPKDLKLFLRVRFAESLFVGPRRLWRAAVRVVPRLCPNMSRCRPVISHFAAGWKIPKGNLYITWREDMVEGLTARVCLVNVLCTSILAPRIGTAAFGRSLTSCRAGKVAQLD